MSELVAPAASERRAGGATELGLRAAVRNALGYLGGNFASQIVALLQGLLLRVILEPAAMGYWNVYQVTMTYVQPLSLGPNTAANWQLPQLHGRGLLQEERHYRAVALLTAAAEACLLGIGVIAFALWKWQRGAAGMMAFALVVTGLALVWNRIWNCYVQFFQCASEYIPLSKALVSGNAIYAAALVGGAWLASIAGVLWIAVPAEVARALWTVRRARAVGLRHGLAWDPAVWRQMVHFGLRYFAADYPHTFFLSFDLLWITHFLGVAPLAIYAFGKSFFTQTADVTVRVANVAYRRTLTQMGSGVEQGKIAEDMKRFLTFQLLVATPAMCAATAAIVPFLIIRVAPHYSASIPVLLALLPAALFYVQNNNLHVPWVAGGRMLAYGRSNAAAVAFFGFAFVTVWFGLADQTLTGLANAAVSAFAAYFTYMMFTAGRELWGWRQAARSYAEVMGASLLLGWSVRHVAVPAAPGPWHVDLAHALLAAAELALWLAPLWAFGIWRSRAGGELWRIARESWRHGRD